MDTSITKTHLGHTVRLYKEGCAMQGPNTAIIDGHRTDIQEAVRFLSSPIDEGFAGHSRFVLQGRPKELTDEFNAKEEAALPLLLELMAK